MVFTGGGACLGDKHPVGTPASGRSPFGVASVVGVCRAGGRSTFLRDTLVWGVGFEVGHCIGLFLAGRRQTHYYLLSG